MKNLNIIFNLLLVPFNYLIHLPVFKRLNISTKLKHSKQFNVLFILLALASPTYLLSIDYCNPSDVVTGDFISNDTFSDSGAESSYYEKTYYFTIPKEGGILNVTINPAHLSSFGLYYSFTSCPTTSNSSLLNVGRITFPPVSYERSFNLLLKSSRNNTINYDFELTFLKAELSINKSVSSSSVYTDADFSYSISVQNSGNGTTTNVSVTDTIPTGLTLQSVVGTDWSCNGDPDVVCSYIANNGIFPANITSTLTLNVTAPETVPSPPQVINTATLSAANGTSVFDSASTTIIETPTNSADLNITKTATQTTAELDATFDYVINVGNDGPDAAQNIIVTDILPDGVSYNSYTASDWTCAENSGTVNCTHNGDMASGVTHDIVLNVDAPGIEGIITNEANVTSDNDPNTSNNSSSVDVKIVNTDNPADLCYINSTGTGNKCETVGSFYYGPDNPHTCVAEVDIRNQNLTEPLTLVKVYKVYTPDVDNGTCTDVTGYCTGAPRTTSYGEGYEYNISAIAVDTNVTISDTNTYYSGSDVSDITLYGQYHKSDGFDYAGEIYACASGSTAVISEFAASVDIIDDSNSYTYANSTYDSWIQTKVSQQGGYTFTAVYLGKYGEDIVPQPYYPAGGNQASSITVLYKVADMSNGATCESAPTVDLFETVGGNVPVVSIIDAGETFGVSNAFVMAYEEGGVAYSKKDLRMKYKAVDFNQLFDDAGIQCVQRSSTGGVVEGIPACLITNSPYNSTPGDNYKKVFGENAFNRCYTENGQPCYASNGGVGLAPYDNEYGCFECSLGAFPYECSRDNFAIRPEKFDENLMLTHSDAPWLLRSGEDYNISLTAKDATGDISNGYTINTYNFHNDLETNTTKYFKDLTPDTTGLLHGTSGLDTSLATYYMVNGLSSIADTGPAVAGTADETLTVSYDDVGIIDLFVYDKEWAAVDDDDTPMDCNSTTHTYVCGEKNVRFIPHHFGFSELNITNHAGPDGNFTYIADDRGMPTSITPPTRSPMSARVHTQIQAKNKVGGITENFREDSNGNAFYENNISVTLNVTVPSTGVNSYLYPDANASGISNQLIGFGRAGLDSNGFGTRDILWDESTYPLEFNFDRNMNEPGNPFDVNGSYVSISMTSYYEDNIDPTKFANITGSRIGDSNTSTCIAPPAGSCVQQNAENNATFYFGRAVPSQPLYDDVTTASKDTPIYVYVYCDPTTAQCTDYNIDISAQTNEFDWWFSVQHDMSQGYGDIELETGNIIPSGTATVTTAPSVTINAGAEGKDENVLVTATSTTPRPMTVEIDLVTDDSATDFTHSWLIYNQDFNAIPSPFYRVIFTGGTSTWMGKGKTGHVIGDDINAKKTKRLEW